MSWSDGGHPTISTLMRYNTCIIRLDQLPVSIILPNTAEFHSFATDVCVFETGHRYYDGA